jgi:predicted dehydrogenase
MGKKINIGMIGCGIAANILHWPALKTLQDDFSITAVCNHTPEKATSFARLVGDTYNKEIPVYLNYKELLALETVDAVAVILPIDLNYEVCRAAAEAGKHIMVEKPIAVNIEEAKQLLALEKEFPELTMMVAENFRYRPVYETLKEAIQKGQIGTPYHVEWKSWMNVDPKENQYAQTSWRINHQYEGGFVTDGGVHNIAALRDIFGDLILIGASKAQVNPEIGRTDTFNYLFKSQGRDKIPPVSGLLQMFFSVKRKSAESLIVLGSKGTIELVDDTLIVLEDDASQSISTEKFTDDGGYENEYKDFYSAIVKKTIIKSSFSEAYKDLETIFQALQEAVL